MKKLNYNKNITKLLQLVPNSPGIYQFLRQQRILYIGKATNLYRRVSSYFQKDIEKRPYIQQMIPLIDDIKWIRTDNEIEALILESALIKKYQPKYNQALKDDKSYSWLYIDVKSKFPTVKIVRAIDRKEFRDGRLFGPYPRGYIVKQIFKYIRRLYPFCTCTDKKPAYRKTCLYAQMGLCPDPYGGKVSEMEYRKNIENITKLLTGRRRGVINNLEKEMYELAKKQKFEQAAVLRDRIEGLRYISTSIKISPFDSEQSVLQKKTTWFKRELTKLQQALNTHEPIRRIECYDVSNINGKYAYVSMVVFDNYQFVSDQYRLFKIKDVLEANDPAMLKEAIIRRLDEIERGVDESFLQYPSVILLDGGKSQMSIVQEILPDDIILMGITKGRKYRRKGGRLKDEFWIFDKRLKQVTKLEMKESKILSTLRDEAHRFAIRAHRRKRKKIGFQSKLETIKFIGPVSQKELLKKFGSVDRILTATRDELQQVLKNKRAVQAILKYSKESSKKGVASS